MVRPPMSVQAATVTQLLHQMVMGPQEIIDPNQPLMEAARKIRKMAVGKTIEARGQLTMAIQHLPQTGNSE